MRNYNKKYDENYINFALLSLLLMVIAFIFHYINGYYLDNQLFTFLNSPKARFGDWQQDVATISNFSPYLNTGGWHYNYYPPFAYLQVYFINKLIVNNSFPIYSILFLFLYSSIILYKFKNNLYKKGDGITVLNFTVTFVLILNYPIFFVFDRGNVVIIPFLYLLIAFLLFPNNKIIQPIFIGLAAATKIYPGIFLLKYIWAGEYKSFFIGLTTTIILTLGSFFLYEGGFLENILKYLSLLSQHSKNLTFTHGQPLWFSVDLWAYLQIIWAGICKISGIQFTFLNEIFGANLIKIYNVITFSLLLYGGFRIKNKSEIEIIVFYTLTMIFIQPFSYDYHLAYILIPFACYLIGKESTLSSVVFYLLLFLIAPKGYYLARTGDAGISYAQISCILNPTIIIASYYYLFKNKKGL